LEERILEGYRTDEEQVEHLKKWWDENGKSIIGGIALGLIAIFGWRGWQDHLVEQGENASELYEQMATDIREEKGKDTEIEAIADQLHQDYKSTPYSTFSSLLQARKAVEKDDIHSAKLHLQRVLDNTNNDEFRHIARLRLSRLLLTEGDKDAALSLLEKVDPGKFASSYHELRGDILLQQGDSIAARDAYTQALATQNSIRGNQSVVQMKLDDLGANQL
jgi:predicted negative regulator of RcsB-dependent stress response